MMGGRKQEDGKEEKARKKEITYHVNALMLNNNEIREISGLYDVLKDFVLYDITKLEWLNLSYNYLVNIDKEILSFENLKSL
jgi:Leucine-rich repeat (LRR) protein